MRHLAWLCVALVGFLGCGDDDAGSDGGTGVDGGAGVLDGGTPRDGATAVDGGGSDAGLAADGGLTPLDPALTTLIEMGCTHTDECGALVGTVEACVMDTTTTYSLILDACPGDLATLTGLLDCYIAASCPLDTVCADESTAFEAVRMRCLGV